MDRFRGRDGFDDEFFKELEKEIRAIEKRLNRMLEEQSHTPFTNINPEAFFGNKPFVYGFSLRMGEEGEPEIKEFGDNVRKTKQKEDDYLVDIFEEKDKVRVVAEVPVDKKQDIDLRVKGQALNINCSKANYSRKVRLPCKVEAKESEAHYKNGVLQVILQPKEDENGDRIDIN